jgi:hypothetical protein
MIKAHKRKDHSVHLINPITDRHLHVVGTIYVDDTDLNHFDMCTVETMKGAHANFQESIRNWGLLLIATGGALKPIKCFYQLISFSWKADGSWSYENNHVYPEYSIMVPLEDGSSAEIKHLDIYTPTKTLGLMTAPTGSNAGALAWMKENAEGRLVKASGAKHHKRNVWFLLDKQFWSKETYGISATSAPFKDLDKCLMRTYYDLLPRSGNRKSIRRELRQMDRDFYGIGFPHPEIECLAGKVTKLLSHYGSTSGLGKHMQVSMVLLVIEVGISLQPLLEQYRQYSAFAPYGSYVRCSPHHGSQNDKLNLYY